AVCLGAIEAPCANRRSSLTMPLGGRAVPALPDPARLPLCGAAGVPVTVARSLGLAVCLGGWGAKGGRLLAAPLPRLYGRTRSPCLPSSRAAVPEWRST